MVTYSVEIAYVHIPDFGQLRPPFHWLILDDNTERPKLWVLSTIGKQSVLASPKEVVVGPIKGGEVLRASIDTAHCPLCSR